MTQTDRPLHRPHCRPAALPGVALGLFCITITLLKPPAATAADYLGIVRYRITPATDFTNFGFNPGEYPETAQGGQVVGSGRHIFGAQHAFLWTNNGSVIDLNPPSSAGSNAYGVSNNQEVGAAYAGHAVLWSGTAASAVDLHPAWATGISLAQGTDGTRQVGWTSRSGIHATFWSGTAASAVDLHPAGYENSQAFGVSATKQIGYGSFGNVGNNWHALLWSGTAASVVDLHPAQLQLGLSFAFGIGGNQQVGYGNGNGNGIDDHAVLWTGTAASAVDLNPTDYLRSHAFGTNGVKQVGYAFDTFAADNHAIVWSGDANSFVDLNAMFPPGSGSFLQTAAYTIDGSGTIYGIADGTYNNVFGTYAVQWVPVPEPATALSFAIGISLLFSRSHRRRIPVP
jgi:probable HAF family extracellular repeat protein